MENVEHHEVGSGASSSKEKDQPMEVRVDVVKENSCRASRRIVNLKMWGSKGGRKGKKVTLDQE